MGTRAKRAAGAIVVVAAAFMTLGSVTAGANTVGPYPTGTMFIADENCSCVWRVAPGGGSTSYYDASGETPSGVAADSAGDVFWTQSNSGTVNERTAAGNDQVLASGFAPWGIAVDGSGNVYFGSFASGSNAAGLYEIPSGGSPQLLTTRFGVFTSLAIDGNGDVWGAASSNELVVVPPGTSGEQVTSPGVGVNGVTLDGSNDVFASSAFGDSAIELVPGAVSATTLGTVGGYAEGIAVDGSGNVFVGKSATVPGYGDVYEIPPGGGTPTLYADGQLATTNAIAVYPPPAPVSRSSASITLSSPNSSNVTTETTVTLTATVPSGETGGVQFDDNGYALGNAMTTSGGAATTTTTLSAGTHDITATYLGDSSNAPAISNDLTFTSTAIPSKTVLSFPNGTTVAGDQQLTVDASVSGSGGVPTGYVGFYDGTKYEGSAQVDSSGNTSFQFAPTTGTSKVHAVYEGDTIFATSTSRLTTVTTTTPYTPTLSTRVRYGKPLSTGTVKATITVTVTGVRIEPAPTGVVSASGGFTCGALSAVAGTDRSTASCSNWMRSGVSKQVTLTFTSGDGNYDSGTTYAYVSNGGGGGGGG